jgi:hypothetical protein
VQDEEVSCGESEIRTPLQSTNLPLEQFTRIMAQQPQAVYATDEVNGYHLVFQGLGLI